MLLSVVIVVCSLFCVAVLCSCYPRKKTECNDKELCWFLYCFWELRLFMFICCLFADVDAGCRSCCGFLLMFNVVVICCCSC